ncbi:hypothetical protein [Streptomyces sp. NPDC005262]|uniref:hypothetical protein n=1 Tax=Streptomyces sp. NPDC005262 TaxID=3364710 RepID=UPI003698333C
MDLDTGAAVPTQQACDVLLELPPVHGVDGGHDSGKGALLPGALQSVRPLFVLGQLALYTVDVRARRDEIPTLLARSLDEGVEHGDDGLAEDVGDAVVDAVVEVGGGAVHRVVHRLSPCGVLRVEEVRTHLTCDFAVPEKHGDVEDGSPREESKRRRA